MEKVKYWSINWHILRALSVCKGTRGTLMDDVFVNPKNRHPECLRSYLSLLMYFDLVEKHNEKIGGRIRSIFSITPKGLKFLLNSLQNDKRL